MSQVEEVIETIPAAGPEQVEQAPPEAPEQRYTYQPTDDAGRKMGGPQVIKYRTSEELAEKLAEQNTLLLRKLREETRKNRLGVIENADIGDDAPRYADPIEFKPRELTNEERFELSRDLLDPEKAIEAQARLFEASVGVSPEALRTTLSQVQETNTRILASQEADAFMAANPDYVMCPENRDAIMQWLMRYDLAPVRQNMQRAYDFMKNQDPPLVITKDMLVAQQVPITEPVLPTVASPEPLPAPERPQYAPAAIPSGFSRADSTPAGNAPAPGSDIVYEVVVNGQKRTYRGMAALNAMPGDEYLRRTRHEQGFAAKVKALDDIEARKQRGQ